MSTLSSDEPSVPWVREFLICDIVDLGASDQRLAGIFAPENDKDAERVGITDQFLANAGKYNETYSNTAHFDRLFEQAFRTVRYSPPSAAAILDIGCGSGANSVVPCLQLFPECRIVASDLSPDLLRLLRAYLQSKKLEDRVACFCADAMNDYFQAERFDVVVGAAILHHVLDPIRTLKTASRALRPGGIAIFFEPFEGMALVRIAFTLILERAEREQQPLDQTVADFLKAMIVDIEARTGTDKSREMFRYMDDKWLFTRTYMEEAAAAAGFSSLRIVPHARQAHFVRDYVVQLLRLGIGADSSALPGWAWEMVQTFDAAFSPEMMAELSFENTVVFQK